jgi:hypothetical protein
MPQFPINNRRLLGRRVEKKHVAFKRLRQPAAENSTRV